MGPFPHDAPPPKISDDNPMGTDGFEFVSSAIPSLTSSIASSSPWAFGGGETPPKEVTLYRQGDINFVLNAEPDRSREVCRAAWALRAGDGFRVVDAARL